MKSRKILLTTVSGFNRYMVECEYRTDAPQWHRDSVLIDTWWNVNEEEKVGADAFYWF